jgi:transposase-like protein
MKRMPEEKAQLLMKLFRSGIPMIEIAYQLDLTPDAVALKITSLRKEGHDLPRRRRPTTNRGMKYRKVGSLSKPRVEVDWKMRPCLGVNCQGKLFNSPSKFVRLCRVCKNSNVLMCDRIPA